MKLECALPFIPDSFPDNRILVNFRQRKIVFYSRLNPLQDAGSRKNIHVVFDDFTSVQEFVSSPEQIKDRNNFCGIFQNSNADSGLNRTFRFYVYPDSYFEVSAKSVRILDEKEVWLGDQLTDFL